jgi:copper chaperone CopZ
LLTLAVPSITCGSCEGRITRALEGRAGVRGVQVDLRARVVRVAYDPALADPKALAEAVTAAGYPARYLAPGAPLPAPARGGGGCCDNRS